MSSRQVPDRRTDTTRAAILGAAERLFAERGVSAVPLREISAAAAQRNHSATQYHFGTREGLVDAIIESRSPEVDSRRRALLDELDAADQPGGSDAPTAEERVRRLVEIVVRPWAECLLAAAESYYLRFLARCMDEPSMRRAWRTMRTEPTAVREANDRLLAEMHAVPPPVALRRLEWLASVSLNVLADEERRGRRDPAEVEAVCADLVGMLTGLLRQPA